MDCVLKHMWQWNLDVMGAKHDCFDVIPAHRTNLIQYLDHLFFWYRKVHPPAIDRDFDDKSPHCQAMKVAQGYEKNTMSFNIHGSFRKDRLLPTLLRARFMLAFEEGVLRNQVGQQFSVFNAPADVPSPRRKRCRFGIVNTDFCI
jgi:hypothetical protein